MLVKLLRDVETSDGAKPAGEIIDHPDSHWLIRMGLAEAADKTAQEKHDEFLEAQRKRGGRPPSPTPGNRKTVAAAPKADDAASSKG